MKKIIKICLMVLLIMLCFIVGDTIYSVISNSIPIIHFKDKTNNIDRGIFFDVYHCDDKENKIVGKFSKYECSVDDKVTEQTTTITTTNKISTRKKKFSEEILNKYTEYGNVDKENLKSFEIIDILNYGYYASNPDEVYYQVRFNYECKDDTKSCVSLKIKNDYLYFNEYDGYYNLWLIAKNEKVIKFITGVSINMNSNFVFESKEIK